MDTTHEADSHSVSRATSNVSESAPDLVEYWVDILRFSSQETNKEAYKISVGFPQIEEGSQDWAIQASMFVLLKDVNFTLTDYNSSSRRFKYEHCIYNRDDVKSKTRIERSIASAERFQAHFLEECNMHLARSWHEMAAFRFRYMSEAESDPPILQLMNVETAEEQLGLELMLMNRRNTDYMMAEELAQDEAWRTSEGLTNAQLDDLSEGFLVEGILSGATEWVRAKEVFQAYPDLEGKLN